LGALIVGGVGICCIYKCCSVHPFQTFLFEKRNTEHRVRKSLITKETTQRLQQHIQENPPEKPPRTRKREPEKAAVQLKERIGNGIILLLTQAEFSQHLPRIWRAIRHDTEMPRSWTPNLNDQPEGLIDRVLGLKRLAMDSRVQLAYLNSVVGCSIQRLSS